MDRVPALIHGPSRSVRIALNQSFLVRSGIGAILLAICTRAAAADEFTVRTWHSDEGLPHNLVRSLAQTRDGYLWVGTYNGLARFDGMRFTTFDSNNTPALTSCNISDLVADSTGALWINTFGGGLFRLKDGVFTHFGIQDGLPSNELTDLCQARDGSLWLGTSAGASHFKDGKFANYSITNGLATNLIRSILEDRDGSVWIATTLGLNRLRGNAVDLFNASNSLLNNSIRGLWQDNQGRVWIGSDAGLTCYDGKNWHNYAGAEGFFEKFVQTFCEDRLGNLWIGTYGGLVRFKDGKFYDETSADKEPFDRINALCVDQEGDVWAGSREGLIRLTPKRFSTYSKRDGLAHNNVLSVEEDRLGNIWIGTWGGGLDQLSRGTIKNYSRKIGFPLDLVLSTCSARDGSLWVGADYNGGVVQLKGDSIERYTSKDGLFDVARVIKEGADGAVWIGTSEGLNCLRNGKITSYTVKDNHLAGPVVRDVCVDHLNRVWVGTQSGLSLLQGNIFTNFTTRNGLSSSFIVSLSEDTNGDLWIGTIGGGLNRLHNGHFTSYTTAQGLFNNDAFQAIEDDHGYFWITCFKGVYRVRKSDFDAFDRHEISSIPCVFYGQLEGLSGLVFNYTAQPSGWKCRDGRILFPTTKGLVQINTSLPFNQTPPPVVIEQVAIDGRTMDLLVPSPTNSDTIPLHGKAGAIQVPPGANRLEISYTALSLQLAKKNAFKYMLEGVDSGWVDAGSRRVAYYSHVPPGDYRFRVTACNNDGVWNNSPALLTIQVLPHFWNTIWFQMSATFVLAGGLVMTVRKFSFRKMNRRLAALQSLHNVERERARIARDIHDDLGARLTQITMLSDQSQTESHEEARNNARKISTAARDLAQSLDEIVWAVNPRHDTVEGLVEYLSQYTDDYLEDTAMHSHLKLPETLPHCIIPAESRHSFFLAFKEALHNAVKHGRASEIEMELIARPDLFQVVLKDNGVGFDPAILGIRSNGLRNMRQRLERVGGRFDISSQPGHGTRVTLSIRLETVESPLL